MSGDFGNLYAFMDILDEIPRGFGHIFGTIVVVALLALAGTVALMALVLPEKRRGTLNTFFRAVADLCNFRGFFLGYILKAVYIFLTLFLICLGVGMLFQGANFWTCLVFIVVLPIELRVVYELLFLFIKLVRSVVQINQKLGGDRADDPLAFHLDRAAPKPVSPAAPVPPAPPAAPKPAAPVPPAPPAAPEAPKMVFCPHCGTQYDSAKGGCPNGCNQ